MDDVRSHRILVVEDDAAVAEGLVESLALEGFEVHWESTCDGALAWALSEPTQIVVLDVRLPDGSGFDVLRQMRAAGMRQPILMLTVQADEIDKVLGLQLGADDYLTKPFLVRELLARVRSLLRRSYGELSSGDANVLYVSDLVIDLGRASVSRDGRELALTATEYRLLIFMGRHPGQVLSRSTLIDNVWGADGEFYDENTVSVQVRRLREKIERDPSDPHILLTAPGLGYKLAD
jgi:DNA-binding response OmpR family regulator